MLQVDTRLTLVKSGAAIRMNVLYSSYFLIKYE